VERRTYSAKIPEVRRDWFVVDAEGKTLGRLATAIAATLRGKNKPIFTPHVDTGDFVIVLNAGKVKVTGKKETQKQYYRHSNYPGGLKTTSLRDMRARHPERIIENAVRGMLPHNTLGRQQFKKLKVFTGPNHPHGAQNPRELVLDDTASRS
jgi:large subunit ribosomal protein L13